MLRRQVPGYNFVADPDTGVTFRWGESLVNDPEQAPWPELADISISNFCSAGCEYCYRGSDSNGRIMTLAEYENVLDQLKHQNLDGVFQVVLGARGAASQPDIP